LPVDAPPLVPNIELIIFATENTPIKQGFINYFSLVTKSLSLSTCSMKYLSKLNSLRVSYSPFALDDFLLFIVSTPTWLTDP
jgi:hypothetical protein